MKSDGMLYDFPVRLSTTVRDSVVAFEPVGFPMAVTRGQRGRGLVFPVPLAVVLVNHVCRPGDQTAAPC